MCEKCKNKSNLIQISTDQVPIKTTILNLLNYAFGKCRFAANTLNYNIRFQIKSLFLKKKTEST